ncbi:MAG: hypothetical protein IJR13_07665 [Bacteroidales bacterium]|nr:hypothetical protein [Bacteroidales bacterium]
MSNEPRFKYNEKTVRNGHLIPVGSRWTALDGTVCVVVPAQRVGILACNGCHYLCKDGTVKCHQIPACKWWTRADKSNIIFKPISTI